MRNIDLAAIEKFFVSSLPIVGNIATEPRLRPDLNNVAGLPFMTESDLGLTVLVNKNGAAVMKGTDLVASIGRLNELVVAKEYRGKGIASALIVAWAKANPWYIPDGQMPRTAAGAAAYKKAWDSLKPFYTNLKSS
jgi:GNAT superfamily N-acetyltransferase